MKNFSNVREIQDSRFEIAQWLKSKGRYSGQSWTNENYTADAMLNGVRVRLSVCFTYGNRTGLQPGYIQVGYPDGVTWLDTQTASESFYTR